MRGASGYASGACLLAAIAAGAPPGEVPRDMRFTDRATLAWQPVPDATAYNVYRGSLPAASDATCLVWATASTSATIPDAPGPGSLHYFLVAAANGDGEGPLGVSSRGAARTVAETCDSDGDGIPTSDDNCPLVSNPGQDDQDADGEGDRCDPQTYDFEADSPGLSPIDVSPIGGTGPGLAVRDDAGDLAAAFGGTDAGLAARLDRVLAAMPHQETTLWVDLAESPGSATIEMWSDGAEGWNAGSGLALHVDATGAVSFVERFARTLTAQSGPLLPAGGRLRLRLAADASGGATARLDTFDGSAWILDAGVFPVRDVARHAGLATVLADNAGGARAIRRITVNHEIPAAPFTVLAHPSWSCDWKVFQRDGSDRATIPVRFAYRWGAPARVEARVVSSVSRLPLPGHDFGHHVAALTPAPGGGLGVLDVGGVPAGGNYDVELILKDESSGTVTGGGFLGDVAVGDVFVAGGQSNMSGWSGSIAGEEPAVDAVHLFGNDHVWKRADEPMDSPASQVDRVSADLFAVHSLMLSFGKAVASRTGFPVGIIPGPLGNTALFTSWQRNALDPDDRGRLYGSLLHRSLLQGGLPPRGFLWFQGESDAIQRRTSDQYATDLRDLIDWYRRDLGDPALPWVIAQIGTNETAPLTEWLGVQEAQRVVASGDARAVLVTTMDQPLHDGNHFTVAGYQEIGRRFASAALGRIWDLEPDLVPDLVEARAEAPLDSIRLTFERTLTGGDVALFQATDAAGTPNVVSLDVAGNEVTVRLDRPLVLPATIGYGSTRDPGAAWLRDAAGIPAPAFLVPVLAP